ncbi:MAG: hypothetical protein BroJett031_32010 [Betaproteobacteria bacterium]|nr:MAG: hypothetical protein BroJett031_32010 [Betaproteobacteria bacterium]
MNLLVAETCTRTLTRLTGNEERAVKTTAFANAQRNPADAGTSFHKLRKDRETANLCPSRRSGNG